MATSFLQVKNRATGVLQTAVGTGDTTFVLKAGHGAAFPSTFPYDLTVEDEIIHVTNRVTDTLTVTRGAQGTAAATHAADKPVALNVTALNVSELQVAVNDLENESVLLAGRAGGQTVIGGTAANDDLMLQANSVGGTIGAADEDHILINDRIQMFPSGVTLSGETEGLVAIGATAGATITIAAAATSIRALSFPAALLFDYGTNNPGPIQLFNFSSTITAGGARNFPNPHTFLRVRPVYTLDPTAASTLVKYIGAESFPTFTSVSPGSATMSYWRGHNSGGALGTGYTTPIIVHYNIEDVTGAGGATEQVGLEVPAFALGTTKLSVRSAGADVQQRHAGPVVIGANAGPTNASVGLEVQSTTRAFLLPRMTTAQRDTMTGIAVADGMVIYNTTTAQAELRKAGAWVGL